MQVETTANASLAGDESINEGTRLAGEAGTPEAMAALETITSANEQV